MKFVKCCKVQENRAGEGACFDDITCMTNTGTLRLIKEKVTKRYDIYGEPPAREQREAERRMIPGWWKPYTLVMLPRAWSTPQVFDHCSSLLLVPLCFVLRFVCVCVCAVYLYWCVYVFMCVCIRVCVYVKACGCFFNSCMFVFVYVTTICNYLLVQHGEEVVHSWGLISWVLLTILQLFNILYTVSIYNSSLSLFRSSATLIL